MSATSAQEQHAPDPSLPRAWRRNPARWLWAICASLVVGLIVSASVTLVSTRGEQLATAMDNLARVAITLSEHTHAVVFGADLIVSNLQERIAAAGARTPETLERSVATPAMHELLRDMVVASAGIEALAIADGDGRVLGSSRSWPPPAVNLADRDFFATLRDNPDRDHVITEPLKNRATGQESMFLVRRISAPDGTFLGVITGTISASRFEKLFASVLPSEGASISIYRRDGLLLVSQPRVDSAAEPSPEVRQFFADTTARAELGTLHTAGVSAKGGRQLMVLSAVRGYSLLVNVVDDEAMVLAGWKDLAAMIVIATAAAIVLIVVLGIVLMRQMKMHARVTEYVIAREAAERARAVAEESNKAKSHFLANMSHELRTPLNAVIGFSELLATRHFGPLNPRQAGYVADIRDSGNHLLNLINGILDMSKIEARRYELSEAEFEIRSVFDDAIRLVSLAAAAAGVAIHIRPAEAAVCVRADRRTLLQVITNLLSNAVKFTGRGGSVALSAAIAADGAPTIAVRDSGCGIPAARLATIFEPFQSANSELSRAHSGTGLGLSICKALVEAHDGTLSIESVVSRGTVATIRLPPERAAQAPVLALASTG